MKPIFKRIHTDKKTHQYNQCKKDFTCANFICRHERSCSAEQHSEFIQCGKAFACQSHSQRHVRIHNGEKHYDCNQCGKDFGTRSIL